jgi:CRP-like cAMP-binding protein
MIEPDDLRNCELFANLSEEELSQVAEITVPETYEAGDLICIEWEVADRLFILRQGRVQLHIQLRSALEPSGELTIEEVEPGRIFGWSSMVKQRRFTASARAIEPSEVLSIAADRLDALFDQNPHLGFVVTKQLAEVIASRLRHTREACTQTAAAF